MQNSVQKCVSEALALVFLGKFADAELALQSLRLEHGDNPDVALGLALLRLYCADYEGALAFLGEALPKKPDVARIHILMAFALAKTHRIDEATEYFYAAKGLNPDDERLLRVEAAIMMEHGKSEEALGALSMYALEHPDDPWDVWNDLGTLYYISEQFESAEQSFHQAIKSAGSMGLVIPFVHFNLALCCNAVGRLEEAKEQLSIVLENDSSFAPAWAALGLIVAGDGEFERAIEFLNHAIEIQPENPSHWYVMGKIMEQCGDIEAAEHYICEGNKAFKILQPDGEIPDAT